LECTIFPAWQRLGNGAVASVPAPVACARNLDFWWSQISVPKGKRKGERSIWQRRFWEHAIRDERDLENHFAYIRGNPVRHGLVKHIEDWPHSSFYARNG
jgi:REP element-mobilizing transposase RayT